ncbi:MAG: RICIN domain-containing protein [Candidatus Saccharimonadales bacterium]
MSRSKSIKTGLFAIIAVAAVIFGCQTQNASAVKATDFNAGNIISDAVFYNKDAMTLAEIETFIKNNTVACDTWGTKAVGSGRTINGVAVPASTTRAKYADMMIAAGNTRYHKPPYICLTNYYENPTTKKTSFDSGAVKESGMLSAAEIIYKAAQTYNINPQVLLVTLKKEYSYVYTDDWPLRDQYNTVMGYACPDSGVNNTANCNSKYYGFYNQVMNAAWQFNYYKENIKSYNYQPGRTNTIQYTTTTSCGSKQVYIENVATASLYIYTPYTPNAAALAAYPGTATCGSYGNRNFFMFFNEWFGSTSFTPTTASLPSGDYYIVTKSDYDKTLQPQSNTGADGLTITTGARAESTLDTYRITKNSDGTYTIANASTGKVIDVPSASAVSGAALQQWTSNSTSAQKWYLYENDNGSYGIASALNNTLAITSDATTTALGSYIKSEAQSFRFIPTEQVVEDGTYNISSKLTSNFLADIDAGGTANGTAIQMYVKNHTAAQIMQLSYDSKTGYYTITNPQSNKVFDVTGGGTASGTRVQIWKSNNTCSQKWIIQKQSDGEYEFLSACSGKLLDIDSASTASGTRVQIYIRNNSNAQKWNLEKIGRTIPDGLYNISSSLQKDFVLDAQSGGLTDSTNIWAYVKNNTGAQTFKVEHSEATDTYTFTNVQSNKVLDVKSGGTVSGTNVQLYTRNNTCAQRWRVTESTNGLYEIVSTCSNLVLDVSGAGTASGTNVHIYLKNNTSAQKWSFEPVQ